ncbi:MAG: hypothetical protein AAFO04_08400 [Cyanobacteria bacterium J06592_8]
MHLLAQSTTIDNDFLIFLESAAPYIFGGIGAAAGAILKFLTEREKTKINRAKERIERLGTVEERLKHYQNAMQAILAQCEAYEHLGKTFEEGQITARQIISLRSGLDRCQAIAEDVLKDDIFRNERPSKIR